MTPIRLSRTDDLDPVLALLRGAFAYMADRIDPPSSLTRMTRESLAYDAEDRELWVLPGPAACVIFTRQPDHLYIGKLAVAEAERGRGHAKRLIDLAAERARLLGLDRLRLQTRIELTENQAAFRHMGFTEIGRTAHPGYDRPTSITFERRV